MEISLGYALLIVGFFLLVIVISGLWGLWLGIREMKDEVKTKDEVKMEEKKMEEKKMDS